MSTSDGTIGSSPLGVQTIADGSVPTLPHPRRAIRRQVAAILTRSAGADDGTTNWATSVGPRVFTTRTNPLAAKDLPAIVVYTGDEVIDKAESNIGNTDPDNFTIEPGHLKRVLRLRVECVASGTGLDDTLDAIAWQVEAAMEGSEAQLVRDGFIASMLLSSSNLEFVKSDELLVGSLVLTYEMTYYTKTQVPPDQAYPAMNKLWIGVNPNIGAAHIDDYTEVAGD